MANPTSVADIEARWRPLSAQETINANAFLDDAWSYLLAPHRRPTLEDDMTAGTVATSDVRRVVAAMVLRVLKNMDGWTEESIDDWSGKRNDLIASGELFATQRELLDLRPAGTNKQRGVRLVANGDA